MPREIADEINANRRQIGRALAGDRVSTPSQKTGILLSPVPVAASATLDIYTRPVNDTALVGHPDDGNGWGRGRVGDYRGDWTHQESVSGEVTRAGRRSIADALVTGTPRAAGSSTGTAVADAFALDESATTIRTRASFLFDQSPATVSSADVRTSDGRVVAEGSLSGITADAQTEVRVDVTLSFADASRSGSESVTGLGVIADALRTREAQTVTLAEVALGTGTTAPTTTDTALDSEVISANATGRPRGPQAVAQAVLFRSQPSTQPVTFTELGAVGSDGTLLTRVVFAPQDKDDRLRLRARNGVVIQ